MQLLRNKKTLMAVESLKKKISSPSLTLWVSPTKNMPFKIKNLENTNDDDCPSLAISKASPFLFGTN